LRVLELEPGASTEEIRQAYLDLVRVWHSDRFHLDQRMQKIAEARTLQINEAYSYLRTGAPASTATSATGRERINFRHLATLVFVPLRRSSWLFVAALFVSMLAIPPLIATRGIWALADRLDLDQIVRSPGRTPSILTPTKAFEPLDDLRTALSRLSHWTSDDKRSLWQPAPPPSAPATLSPLPGDKPAPTHARVGNRPGRAAVPSQLVPYNGLELIQRTNGGSGEISLRNESDEDAVAQLISGRLQPPIIAIYVARRQAALLSNIPMGVYSVQVEFGSEWDSTSFRFAKDRVVAAQTKPLQFYEVTNESGIRGCTFTVVLRPAQTAVGVLAGSNR
jgi:hypothetical protein